MARTHAHAYIDRYRHTHKHSHTHTHARTHARTHAHARTHTHTHTHTISLFHLHFLILAKKKYYAKHVTLSVTQKVNITITNWAIVSTPPSHNGCRQQFAGVGRVKRQTFNVATAAISLPFRFPLSLFRLSQISIPNHGRSG